MTVQERNNIILSIVNAIVPAIIIQYTFLFDRNCFLAPYVVGVTVVMVLAFGISLFLNNRFAWLLRYISTVFNVSYVFMELAAFLLLSFGVIRTDMGFFANSFSTINSEIGIYDSISGFRCKPGNFRFVSLTDGKLEIDHNIKVNRQGWFSEKDYTFKKRNAKTKRYIVLGDSFSSGLAVTTPWPDLVQKMLAESGNDSVELYNFSLEGIGLENWYRIFMLEILPKYEFDGIIIASSSEKYGVPDFDRKFFIAQSTNQVNYISKIDIVSQNVPSRFPIENAIPISRIYPDTVIDKIEKRCLTHNIPLKFTSQRIRLVFLDIVLSITDAVYKMLTIGQNGKAYLKKYDYYNHLTGKAYKMEDFDGRYKNSFMLKSIISLCMKDRKDIVLINIPDFENVKDYVNGQMPVYCHEHKFLSDHYSLRHFDGFEIFKGKDEAFVNQCFYQCDQHWNKAGVELFVKKLIDSKVL